MRQNERPPRPAMVPGNVTGQTEYVFEHPACHDLCGGAVIIDVPLVNHDNPVGKGGCPVQIVQDGKAGSLPARYLAQPTALARMRPRQ